MSPSIDLLSDRIQAAQSTEFKLPKYGSDIKYFKGDLQHALHNRAAGWLVDWLTDWLSARFGLVSQIEDTTIAPSLIPPPGFAP